MKNILVIGLVSLVLFGVSAGLSVWLQTNTKSADSGHDDKDKKKKPADDHGEGKDTAKGNDHADPHKADPKEKPGEAKPAADPKEADRAEYRRLQMQVVAADVNGQMQEYDRLLKKVGTEMKQLLARQEQLDAKAAEVKQAEDRTAKTAADLKKMEGDPDERASIARIAALADNMPAETTAGIIQQLADDGKTDTAVKVLAAMKERTAAKVLAAITDQTIPPVLIEKMRLLKKPPPAAPPVEVP